jgi:hypothetical protein
MNKLLISTVFLSCLLLGCAPSIKIVSELQDPTYSFGQISTHSKVLLYMADSVKVMDYKKLYEKEYVSDRQFFIAVQKQIADSMQLILGCTVSLNTNLQVAAALSGAQTPAEMDGVFSSVGEDFLLFVKSVEFSKKMNNVSMTPTGMVGGGESCIATMHAEVWNVKQKKKALAFAAVGQSEGGGMFSSLSALKGAVGDVVGNMTTYLKTGATQ